MFSKKKDLLYVFAFALVISVSGCAEDDFTGIIGECPIVVSTIPADGDINVPLDQVISATFNEELNPETVNSQTFRINGANAIAGTVTYSGKTAFFTPSANLLPNTIYTGTLTTAIKDPLGNALQENYVWSFTTIPLITLTASPETSGTVSGAGTFDNGSTVTVIATPNAGFMFTNWTVDGIVVSTDASYQFQMNGNIALVANFAIGTFTLTVNAQNGTVTKNPNQASYAAGSSVTLTANPAAGYQFSSWSGDASGSTNPLTVIMNSNKNITANFTLTVNAGQLCPNPAVNLGTAANYAILAKSGISTTGNTSVTGDMGVSPISSTAITGFGLTLSSDGTYSTSSLVNGRVYAADYASPTPSNLTTAVGNMETAFTTANGLAPDQTELFAGNINNRTLASGVYKWSTGLLVTNSITLDGGGVDCAKFVFQIAGDLTIANNTKIILINGAKADNIYWVVAGAGANLGTDVDFSGNILSKTLISVNTRSTVAGRLLAQSAVTLDGNAIVKPSN